MKPVTLLTALAFAAQTFAALNVLADVQTWHGTLVVENKSPVLVQTIGGDVYRFPLLFPSREAQAKAARIAGAKVEVQGPARYHGETTYIEAEKITLNREGKP